MKRNTSNNIEFEKTVSLRAFIKQLALKVPYEDIKLKLNGKDISCLSSSVEFLS